jgi:hypothetical protein
MNGHLEKTLSNLTQAGPGGVIRPDVTLKEDLTAIETTANIAKNTADDTADLLETRVPEGRTINNKPLDQDLMLSPEDVNTYSRSDIDAKIAAVAAGGYNPVRINGYLLDHDVILSAADIGTYSASVIDGKMTGFITGTRTVNGKPLSSDITITAADVNAYTKSEVDTQSANYVPKTRKVNGMSLTSDITLQASDVGAPRVADVVPRTFMINGVPMTGDSMIITTSGDSYTRAEVDNKLTNYLRVQNDFGLGLQPETLTQGPISDSVKGSGFFEYEGGTEDDGNGGVIPTEVPDRPTGSTKGRLLVMSNAPTYDTGGNMTSPARQDILAFPDDLDGLMFKKNGQNWTELSAPQIGMGFNGDIPFENSDGSKKFSPERLAKPARIVDTANDLTAEQANPVSFSTIFNSWDRVGMTNAAGVDETQQWSFNTSTNKIQCMMNTTGPTGFVTPSRYDKYTLEVQIASTSSDDDGIGVILASTYKDGLNYMLAATRTVGGWGNIWEVALYKIQASSFTKTVITALNLPLKWGNGAYSATRAGSGYLENTGTGWATFPAGVKILAVRNGSSISLQTTDLGETTYVSGANITVDLSTIENGVFLAPAQYGVMAFSQPDATFTTIQLTIDDNRLYDVRNGDIWEYNVSTTTWGKTTGSAYDYLKEGRLYYNPYTKKEFFAETKTRIVPINLGVNDVITKNSDGLVDKPVVLKNNVALRVEATPGSGTTRDAVSMTPAGVLTFGSSSAHTTIYSSDAPTVKVGSVESKIVTESSMPSGDNLGAMTFAKCSSVVAFGATVSGANLTPAAIGASGVVAGTATLTGTWKCLGAIIAADQATLFMKTA